MTSNAAGAKRAHDAEFESIITEPKSTKRAKRDASAGEEDNRMDTDDDGNTAPMFLPTLGDGFNVGTTDGGKAGRRKAGVRSTKRRGAWI